MKSKKNNIEISEVEIEEKQFIETPEKQEVKPKKKLTDQQLENLSKAREKAMLRKQELKELNAKSKGLKEQKLKTDAAEFDKLQKERELNETIKNIEVKPPLERKKKIKKIIYESDTDEESVEEVIVKRKPKQKAEPSYSQLADMSVDQQIKKNYNKKR